MKYLSPAGLRLMGTVLLAGCTVKQDQQAASVTRTDSAGITIVQNHIELTQLPTWTLDSAPTVMIGADSMEPGDFRQLGGGLRLPNGNVLAIETMPATLKLFDTTAAFVRVVARNGGGPGEVKSASHPVLLAGDTVGVYDQSQRRALILNPAGEVVSTVSLPGAAEPVDGITIDLHHGPRLTASNAMVTLSPGMAICPDFGCRDSVSVVRFTGTNVTPDRLFSVYGRQRYDGGRDLRLGASSSLAASGNLIAHVDGAVAMIAIHDGSGRLVRLIRWPALNREYTDADLAEIRRGDSLYGNYNTPERIAQWQSMYEVVRFAKKVSEGTGLVFGADRELWLERNPGRHEDRRPFFVFDSTGKAVAQVWMPRRTWPLQIGRDFVLILTDGPNDENVLQVRRLRRS